ncbi:Franean1_4349 family RiPP [Candidatus Oscillochloris fontis]|uniref:Franean1_4349 family RiPP n=1 Tax=Candidatus Oscillochloris fontis TaxID=2496868 RepID=UPI00101CA0CB|nr:Franean1_4349 family RiPP [Candidatus Oscillochloris fontis]
MSPDLERLIGKAVIDPDFRKKLLGNPDEAIKEAGLSLSDEEQDRVRKSITERSKDIERLSQDIDTAKADEW